MTEAERQLKILVADRDDMDLTLQELKAELRKVATYEDALARLVSTRYDSDTYRASIVKMQSTFRMFAARAERRKLTMDVAHQRRDHAAAKIQKWFRSLKGRWLMRIVRMNKMAIRIQKLWRGGVVRSFKKLLRAIKKLQKVFRGFKARKVFRQMRAVIAAKAFDGIQEAQQVQMTKKVRSKKRKKAKDTESKEDDDAKAAAPAEAMVISSRPTSSRPISARRPSNPAFFKHIMDALVSRICSLRSPLVRPHTGAHACDAHRDSSRRSRECHHARACTRPQTSQRSLRRNIPSARTQTQRPHHQSRFKACRCSAVLSTVRGRQWHQWYRHRRRRYVC